MYVKVNNDPRIALYASKDISAGDELFFNYGYAKDVPFQWYSDYEGQWDQDTLSVSKASKEGKNNDN